MGYLVPPHTVAVVDRSVQLRSTIGTMPWHHEPDPQLKPRQFRATWRTVRREVARSIEQHHDEHEDAVIEFPLPSGEVVRAQWSGPPTIQWSTAVAAASVTAVFDEVLA